MEGVGRTGACPWWEGVGALPPPPRHLENKKKEAVRGNFNLFHLCFTNEIKGGSIHYTCKMEGGGRTGACPLFIVESLFATFSPCGGNFATFFSVWGAVFFTI